MVTADPTVAIEKLLSGSPGRVALVVEADGFSYRRDADEVFASASVIKLPILLAVLDEARRGGVSLDEEFALPRGRAVGGAGLIEFLHEGAVLTLGDLLLFMICLSDNAATNLVIERFGMDRLNGYWTNLGLKVTRLRRLMMDKEARLAGRENTISAAEVQFLLGELAHPRAIDVDIAQQAVTLLARQQFTAGLGFFLPEARVAHKTGELEGLFHDVGIIDGDSGGAPSIIYTFLSDGATNVGDSQVLAGRIGRLVYGLTRDGLSRNDLESDDAAEKGGVE